MKKTPKIDKCTDCGGVHDGDWSLLINMVKGIRLASDEAVASLCAAILEANVAHWGSMTKPQRIAHAKETNCVACGPNYILGAITDDFAPLPRRKAMAKAVAMKSAKKAEADERHEESPVVN